MYRYTALAAATLSLAACKSEGWRYGYEIAPEVPRAAADAVRRGAESWKSAVNAVPGHNLLVVDEYAWGDGVGDLQPIYVVGRESAWIDAECRDPRSLACTYVGAWPDDFATIYLPTDRSLGEGLDAIAAHELGHAMGLKHHAGPYLMNPNSNPSISTPQVDDVAQFLSVDR